MPPAPPPPVRSILHRHRQLAPNASVRVSPLCLGTMNFGDAWKDRMGECSKETTFQILDRFFDKGGNFIDTANGYQNEESEMWLGEWMAYRENRDQIVLATKYSASFKGHEKDLIQSSYGGNGTKSMRLSLEASLKKLQTDYIDLFYVHWWDYATTIPELMHGLNDLVASGKVLYLGISDTPAWVVSKANQYARDHGLRPFAVYQGMWNAALRDMEREIVPMCRDEGMGICVYGALGQGRFQTEAAFLEREQDRSGRKTKPPTQTERAVSKVLEEIATRKNKHVTSIALAYIMLKTPYIFPIVGGRKVEHLEGNIDALEIALEDEEMERIEASFEFDPGFPHTFLSGTLLTGEKPKAANKPDDVWLMTLMGSFDWVQPAKPIAPHSNHQ
ncbi:NADP-dependent oxidoreductase domain-containing protein [Aspergillus pseudocaelatus]|uniref:NADP-dependent oxidoreductase domain-containing protein n=1 Tax=Aspergillus pseudocaelatus TaxID=1825620 RepID=A0ABQ6WUU1_9EURO|nr:NADP-dependent oxidoreductase domain-containing protein [Aspergillus pseudocaelatus]